MDIIPRTPLSHLRYGRVLLRHRFPFILEVELATVIRKQRAKELRHLHANPLKPKVMKAIRKKTVQELGLAHQLVIEERKVQPGID